MNFNDFCAPLYFKPRHKSQGAFVITMLNQAGSNFWKLSSQGDKQYAGKVFRGGKLGQPISESFNDGFKTRELTKWLSIELNAAEREGRIESIAISYGFPKDQDVDVNALSHALAEQLRKMISSPEDGVSVVVAAYEHFRNEPDEPFAGVLPPLVKGDRALVSQPPSVQNYRVPFYQEVEHTWTIQNAGTVSWDGRELRCVDPERSELAPSKRALPIGRVARNQFVKVSTQVQARGVEGPHTSHWIMVDSNGQNCFPNEKSAFNIVIDVINPNLKSQAVK